VYIPSGEFLMGSTDEDKEAHTDEKPQHKIYLDAYWIDKTEVTNKMYSKCVGDGTCVHLPWGNGASSTRSFYYVDPKYANYPVINVDWFQANQYCRWKRGRLPSEAEWEKAARGTDGRIYPWGNENPTCLLANYGGKNKPGECADDTMLVGSHPEGASPYGLMDMAGNLWEWVNDWYDEKYYQDSPQRNPVGPNNGQNKVIKGGFWDSDFKFIRSAARNWGNSDGRLGNYGFRCVYLK
jgi:formylglycine-generating enzyme required for sulfatase activity